MAPSSPERIKIIAVIVLAVIFVIVGYFRFFHGKVAPTTAAPPPPVAPAASTIPAPPVAPAANAVPAVDSKNLPAALPAPQKALAPPLRLRNIFAPAQRPPAGNSPATGASTATEVMAPPKPLPPLKLTGTIIGDKEPLAIINGRFLRTGDRVEGLQVLSISRTQVSLAGEGRTVRLEVLADQESRKTSQALPLFEKTLPPLKKGEKGGFKNW